MAGRETPRFEASYRTLAEAEPLQSRLWPLRAPGFPSRSRGGPPVFLVTGCSSGIGRALALRLAAAAARGECRALLTARAASLAQLGADGLRDGDHLGLTALDVTSDAERRAAVALARERWGGVDVLINNAGISYRAALEDMTAADELAQQEVNHLGPLALCRMVLPHMRAQRWGRILNVSSVSGMMAMPTMGSYSASKWALEGASESLWYEMRPWGVRVTLVQPGFIRSDSFTHVLTPSGLDGARSDYAAYYRNMAPFVARLMQRARATPDDVAARILHCAQRRRPPLRLPVTGDARVFYLLRRLLPRRAYHALLFRMLPGVSGWVPPAAGDGSASR